MTKKKSNLLDALTRVVSHIPKPFLAPIPDAEVVNLFSLQDGVPYWFKLQQTVKGSKVENRIVPGWWNIIPTSKSTCRLDSNAAPFEFLEYLHQLPRFLVINLFPVTETTSLVVPWSASDAAQRGWLNSTPRVMHLCRQPHAVESPFGVIVARDMAGTLLYDSLTYGEVLVQLRLTDNLKNDLDIPEACPKNFRLAYDIVLDKQRELVAARQLAEAMRKVQTTEGQIKSQLDFIGANLINFREVGSRFDVTYRYEGAEFTVAVGRDMRIDSAGICLSNTDSNYDLTAIVNVMQQARRERRFDLDRSLHL